MVTVTEINNKVYTVSELGLIVQKQLESVFKWLYSSDIHLGYNILKWSSLLWIPDRISLWMAELSLHGFLEWKDSSINMDTFHDFHHSE